MKLSVMQLSVLEILTSVTKMLEAKVNHFEESQGCFHCMVLNMLDAMIGSVEEFELMMIASVLAFFRVVFISRRLFEDFLQIFHFLKA